MSTSVPAARAAGLLGRRPRRGALTGSGVYLAFLAPSTAVLIAITLVPLVFLVAASFTPLDLTKPGSFRFTGLQNYAQVLAEDRFWNSVWVQARLSFWTVLLQLVLGLGFALLLNGPIRFVEALRGVFTVPMVLPPVVVAVIWKIFFTPDVSVLFWALEKIGLPQPPWLADPVLALWALVVSDTWEWFPFVFLILLAALQMLPQEPMEAARIDGASAWQLFWYVTLPLLRPALLVAGLFRLIDSAKAFPHIFIMTRGGPGTATEATNYYSYLQAFSYSYVGFASAIVVLMLVAVFGISYLLIRLVGTELDVE